MTNAERHTRYRELLRQQAKFEKIWTPRILAALRSQSAPFIEYMQKEGPTPALMLIDSLVRAEPVERVLRTMYQKVGVSAGNNEYAYYLRNFPEKMNQVKAFGFNAFWRDLMNRIFGNIGAEKVTSITETEKKRIQIVLQRGQDESLSNYELANLLRSEAINDARARLVARTELGSAAGEGQELAAMQSGLQLKKTWISVRRPTTRILPRDQFDHFHMSGVQVGPGESFFVMGKNGGEFMRFPHDPTASAGNLCNCLCACIREPV